MKIDSKTMFSTMAPWKLFFTVALPSMVGMFAMSIYSIFEGIFIGQKLGEAAYAVLMYASDMCQPLIYGISDSLAPALGFNWGGRKL